MSNVVQASRNRIANGTFFLAKEKRLGPKFPVEPPAETEKYSQKQLFE